LSAINAVPILLGVLVAVLLGLLGWGLLQASLRARKKMWAQPRDSVLLGMLVLAVFSLGAFAAILLLSVVV
jgi:sulfite exporter TauE/SafE